MIAPEGYSTIALATFVAVVLVGILVAVSSALLWPAIVLAGGFLIFVVSFFRDPARTPPVDPSGLTVVAPADGKVIEIVQEHDEVYVGGPVLRISVFLSPLNVHVNRVPVAGIVEMADYVPGEYLVAWHPKSSEKNERTLIGVKHETGVRVLFKQIAGAVARRVVFHLKVGDHVSLGERFGIVKFGSRMDVLLPETSKVQVQPGQRVVAGETTIATLPGAPAGEATV